LNKATEDELLRIGQEALTNAMRHARAHKIAIDLTFDRRRIVLSITDDGCGFTEPANSTGPNGHFGLKGMKERAAQIRGQIVIRSSSGKGTVVRVEAPAA
jgi:signal transduction histidine kinase